MAAADVPGADAAGRAALYDREPGVPDPLALARGLRRIGHLQRTDPAGAWVAEAADGALVGMALALVREGIWGLSLFGVAAEHRSRGIGRALLDAAFTPHGADARGPLILSSENPAAMRRYARLGLDLRPCVAAAGIPDRSRLAAQQGGVRDAGADGIAVADAIGRAVRGAGHGVDLPVALASPGAHLLLVEDRAFALARPDGVVLLAARDEDAATRVLEGGLAFAPRGATVSI